jgi:hypothetical protein
MRPRLLAVMSALLVGSCRSVPQMQPSELQLGVYRQALGNGSAGADAAAAVARSELASIDPEQRIAWARSAARRQHELALSAADPEEALAREQLAWALLIEACPGCARDRLPVLLQLTRIHAQRGDAAGLASCAARLASAEPRDLDAGRLNDWPLLRQQGELYEQLGLFARAAQIERSLLDAKLQVLDASHPQVAASRARIAQLELRSAEPPPVGAAPPDPAR